jgi:hypothetical protein
MGYAEDKRLHDTIDLIGLRAQATSVGLIQLSIELQRAGVLDEAAVGRVKQAIAKEICLNAPKSVPLERFRENLHRRLDRLFAGEEELGEARAETLRPDAPSDAGP